VGNYSEINYREGGPRERVRKEEGTQKKEKRRDPRAATGQAW